MKTKLTQSYSHFYLESILFLLIFLNLGWTRADPLPIRSIHRDINVNDLVSKKVAKIYIETNRKNFEKSLVLPRFNSIYVTSNGSVVIQLDSSTLQFKNQYTLPDSTKEICQDGAKCNEVKRLTVLDRIYISDTEFPFICYAYDFVYLNNPMRNSHPRNGCFAPSIDLTDKPTLQGLKLGFTSAMEDADNVAFLSVQEGFTFVGGQDVGKVATILRNHVPLINGKYAKNKWTPLKSKMDVMKNPVKFLLAFDTDDTVYFVIRESDTSQCAASQTVTRIVRVCKHDPGGLEDIKEDGNFGTLAKATLDCRLTTTYNQVKDSMLFNAAVDAKWSNSLKMLAVLFHSPWLGAQSSAVCLYSLDDIEQTFRGGNAGIPNPMPNVCSDLTPSSTAADTITLQNMKLFHTQHVLRDGLLSPWKQGPVLIGERVTWQKLAWREVSGLQQEVVKKGMIYVLTEERNVIESYAVALFESPQQPTVQACLMNRYFFNADKQEQVFDFTFNSLPNGLHMVVSTNQSVMQLPLFYCDSAWSQRECRNDPFCRWHKEQNTCMVLPTQGGDVMDSMWLEYEPSTECALTTAQSTSNVIGKDVSLEDLYQLQKQGDWFECNLGSNKSQKCWCQVQQGELQIHNCAVDGGWTEWGEWSRCSMGCNKGQRQRTRSCLNPRPQNGGTPCQEESVESETCSESSESCSKIAFVWSPWSSWTTCSNECGQGQQKRWRKCLTSASGGECESHEELRSCVGENCAVVQERSMWTPWLIEQDSTPYQSYVSTRAHIRVEYTCNRQGSLSDDKSAIQMTVERKICNSDGTSCSPSAYPVMGTWSDWNAWSQCSQSCGQGFQTRERYCRYGIWCFGSSYVTRGCYLQDCPANMITETWLPWSDWSPCSKSCDGTGVQKRHRQCSAGSVCKGMFTDSKECYMGACNPNSNNDPWFIWSAWSSCDRNGYQARHRICSLCPSTEMDREVQTCNDDQITDGYKASAISGFTIFHMLLSGVAGLVVGVAMTFILYKLGHCLVRRQRVLRHLRSDVSLRSPTSRNWSRRRQLTTDSVDQPLSTSSPLSECVSSSKTTEKHNDLSAFLNDGGGSRNPYEPQTPLESMHYNIQMDHNSPVKCYTRGKQFSTTEDDVTTPYSDLSDTEGMPDWMTDLLRSTRVRREKKARASTPPEQDHKGPPLPPKTPQPSEHGSVLDVRRPSYATVRRGPAGDLDMSTLHWMAQPPTYLAHNLSGCTFPRHNK